VIEFERTLVARYDLCRLHL